MLSFFRKGGVGQVVVAAVAIGVMAVFILEFRSGRGGGGGSLKQECAIEAFGDCVGPKDYNAAFGLILYRLQVQPKKIRELKIRKQVLEGMVERELLLREAARLGVAVSEDEIDEELLNGRAHVSLPAASERLSVQLGLCLPNDKQTGCQAPPDLVRILPVKSAQSGQFDTKIYERILRSAANRGPKEFKEMQRRELIAERMRNLVRSRVRVSESAAWLDFERDNARAVVRSVHVKRDWLAKWAIDVSDASTDRWAFEHKEQVDEEWKKKEAQFKAGCALISEIVVPFPPGAEEDDKVEARTKIDEAAAALKTGTAFDVVAKLKSQDENAVVGGEHGCLSETPETAELVAAVGKLKPGGVSPVLETAKGFHIVKLAGRLKDSERESVGRRLIARPLAAKFMADELSRRFTGELIDDVKSGKPIEEAVTQRSEQYIAKDGKAKAPAPATARPNPALEDASKPSVEISPPFNMRINPITEALPSETPAAYAYALDKPGAVYSKPIETSEGVAVMQLKEKTLAKRDDFDKERVTLMRKLREAKETDAVVDYVARLRKAAGSEIKIDERFAADPDPGKDDLQ